MVTRGRAAAGASAGRRGRRPLRFAREWAVTDACPSSGPAGPPSPEGEGKGCCWRWGRRPLRVARGRAAAGGRGGVGAPRPTDGDMETLRGLRGHPFPGRRAVGAGHARPGGLREHPSMVRSVGRGLDPSAGGNPGKDVGASLRGASGTPPPTVCPGMGGGGRPRRGGGTPPYGWGYGNAVGFTWAPVPGPPHGRGRACPARGFTQAPVNGSVRREGS